MLAVILKTRVEQVFVCMYSLLLCPGFLHSGFLHIPSEKYFLEFLIFLISLLILIHRGEVCLYMIVFMGLVNIKLLY